METAARQQELLLVIDLQNAYAPGGVWACEGMQETCMRLRELLDSGWAERTGTQVVLTRFLASETATGVWAEYNRVNAEVNADANACALHPLMNAAAERYPVYDKSVYSALSIPALAELAKGARRVAVAGVVAECCVLSTVMALIDAGCSVVWLTDAIAGETAEKKAAVENVLQGLEYLHLQRMTLRAYAASVSERSQAEAAQQRCDVS